MIVEISVDEINETVEVYTLNGEAVFHTEDGEVLVDFTYFEESGLPSTIELTGGEGLERDEFEDVDIPDAIKKLVEGMFNTGNLIEPGYVFEDDIDLY